MSTKSKGLTIIKDICERFSLKLNIKSDSNGTIITIENNRGNYLYKSFIC